jgi:hypothetical protein
MSKHRELLDRIADPLFRKTLFHAEQLTLRLRVGDLGNLPNVARFGDGEILCVIRQRMQAIGCVIPEGNCDGHPYSIGLSDALLESLETFCRLGCWLGNWAWFPLGATIHQWVQSLGDEKIHWADHELFMMSHGQNEEQTKGLYLAMRDFLVNKVLIGPARIVPRGCDFLRCGRSVIVPEINGWSQYRRIKEELFTILKTLPESLVFLCYGMPAKPLMAEGMAEFPRARFFDIGSGLDPLCGVMSRPGPQWSREKIQGLFAEVLA